MANVTNPPSGYVIAAADAHILGGDSTGQVSVVMIELTSSSFSGSITIKGRKAGTALTPVAIPYKSRFLNNAVGTEAYVSTAITNTSLIEVNAAGLDIVVDCTSRASGSMALDYLWLIG